MLLTSMKSEDELECLGNIIEEAKRKVDPKPPSVTDVLKVYDEFINRQMISPNSAFAQNLYRKILQVARKMRSGDDWSEKISKEDFSITHMKPPRDTISSGRTSFSFRRDSIKENRPMNNQSFVDENHVSDFFSRDYESKRSTSTVKNRRSFLKEENNDYSTEKHVYASGKKESWDGDLAHVYKNKHLKEEKAGVHRTSPSHDSYSIKYRDHSPPVRGQNTDNTMTNESFLNKENYDVNKPQPRDTLELGQVYNIFKNRKSKGEYKRPQSVTNFARPVENSEYKPMREESWSNRKKSLNNNIRLTGDFEMMLLNKYFEALKIHYLRRKRLNKKIESFRASFREDSLRRAMKAWRHCILGKKAALYEAEDFDRLYEKKLVAKHFSIWKTYHEKITRFTSGVRDYLLSRRLGLANKIFSTWKNYLKEKKTERINRVAAKALWHKNTLKSVIKGWKHCMMERSIMREISLQICLKYKEKLKSRTFLALKNWKQNREEKSELKFSVIYIVTLLTGKLLNKGDIFYKKKSFLLFQERYSDYKKERDLQRQAKKFWLRHNFRIFIREYPQ